jgi:hypothetical protein
MKKLSMLGIIGGAVLLTAAPFSLQWSQKNVALSLDTADARVGRPLTPLSVAGVRRRAYRRAYRGAVYGGAAAYGAGSYYGYGYPSYSGYGYGYPAYSGYGYGYPAHSGYYAPQSYYGYYRRPYLGLRRRY